MLQVRVSVVREAKSPRMPGKQLPEGQPRLRRMIALGSVAVLAAVALVGSAGAAPTTDTTAVAFVTVPTKTVMSNNSIPAGNTESAVVIGGTSTVPSNATTVRLEVTARGTANGTITLFPAGNEAGGAGHTVSWAAGQTVTEVEAENVGLANKVSVKNSSAKAAVVTLKITGYSTQVTAGDINGSGGSAGQVLTNNGSGGATWVTPPAATRVAQSWNRTLGSGVISESLRSVTIHAPEAGFVVVQASTVARGDFGCPCSAHARVSEVGGTAATSNDVIANTSGSLFTTVSPTWTFAVTQGTHTFELRVGEFPTNSMSFFNPQIHAIFVPDGTSNATASSPRLHADTKPGPAGTRLLP